MAISFQVLNMIRIEGMDPEEETHLTARIEESRTKSEKGT